MTRFVLSCLALCLWLTATCQSQQLLFSSSTQGQFGQTYTANYNHNDFTYQTSPTTSLQVTFTQPSLSPAFIPFQFSTKQLSVSDYKNFDYPRTPFPSLTLLAVYEVDTFQLNGQYPSDLRIQMTFSYPQGVMNLYANSFELSIFSNSQQRFGDTPVRVEYGKKVYFEQPLAIAPFGAPLIIGLFAYQVAPQFGEFYQVAGPSQYEFLLDSSLSQTLTMVFPSPSQQQFPGYYGPKFRLDKTKSFYQSVPNGYIALQGLQYTPADNANQPVANNFYWNFRFSSSLGFKDIYGNKVNINPNTLTCVCLGSNQEAVFAQQALISVDSLKCGFGNSICSPMAIVGKVYTNPSNSVKPIPSSSFVSKNETQQLEKTIQTLYGIAISALVYAIVVSLCLVVAVIGGVCFVYRMNRREYVRIQ